MSVLLVVASMLAAQSPEAPAPATPSAEEAKSSEKIICKRETVTGSLTQRKRTCMTQREWDRVQNAMRDEIRDYIDKTMASPRN